MKKILIIIAMMIAAMIPAGMASPASASSWLYCSDTTKSMTGYRDGFADRTLKLVSRIKYRECKHENGYTYWQPLWIQGSYTVVGGDKDCRPNPVGTSSVDFYRFNMGDFGVWNPGAFKVNCTDAGTGGWTQPIDTDTWVRYGSSPSGGTGYYTYVDEVVNNGYDNHWKLGYITIN